MKDRVINIQYFFGLMVCLFQFFIPMVLIMFYSIFIFISFDFYVDFFSILWWWWIINKINDLSENFFVLFCFMILNGFWKFSIFENNENFLLNNYNFKFFFFFSIFFCSSIFDFQLISSLSSQKKKIHQNY